MPALPERIRAAALRSQQELADETTPLLRNAWYVAALAAEVNRTPLARRLLDVPVVLFRKLDGTAVALEDRCAHRSFPLSRSALEGDTVVCGYHGARYDCEGRCVQVPSQAMVPPGAIGSSDMLDSPPTIAPASRITQVMNDLSTVWSEGLVSCPLIELPKSLRTRTGLTTETSIPSSM